MTYSNPALEALQLPDVLPASVARVKPDGKPTEHTIQVEEFEREFFKRATDALNAADASLDSRVTTTETIISDATGFYGTLEARIVHTETTVGDASTGLVKAVNDVTSEVTVARSTYGTLNARLSNTETVLGDASSGVVKAVNDVTGEVTAGRGGFASLSAHFTSIFTATLDLTNTTSLASQINGVQADVDDISASGAVYIAAVATPSNATAAFGVHLTAGGTFTGLELIALSAGGGGISLAAENLTFNDSGSADNVFEYSGGRFNFNVPVTIFNQDIGANAVSNQASGVGLIASGSSLNVPITLLAGTRILVQIGVSDSTGSGIRTSSVGTLALALRQYDLYVGGVATGDSLYAYDQIISTAFTGLGGGNAWQFQSTVSPVSDSFLITGLAAGTYSFSVSNTNPFSMRMTMTLTELRDV